MADEDQAGQQVAEEGGTPAAPIASGASESERQLRAELEQTRQGLNSLAAMQIQNYVNSLPPDKQEQARFEIARRLEAQRAQAAQAEVEKARHAVNEEAKSVLVARLAMDHGFDAREFMADTSSVQDPEQLIRIAKRYGERQRAIAEREAPAAVGARPDSGGAGGGASRDDIVAKYRGTGQIAAMHRELRAAGFE